MLLSPSRFVLPSSLLLVVLAAGCGGGKSSLDGTVNFDGQPVDGGSIALYPSGSKESAAGARIVGGRYTVTATDKLAPGTYTVQILWMKNTGKKAKSENDPGNETEETKQVIPVEYNLSSKLTVEIKPGSNSSNFDLKAGGAVSPTPTPGTPTAPGQKKKTGPKNAGDS